MTKLKIEIYAGEPCSEATHPHPNPLQTALVAARQHMKLRRQAKTKLLVTGRMLGTVKPDDALKSVESILGVIMLLILIPAVLVSIWSSMSL